jgi:flagellar hook-associated protein 1 FlgK
LSIFGILNTSKTAVLAHQRAISTTANNIANVNTPGYTRQRANFSAISPTYTPDGIPAGGGTELATVERVVDQSIDNQLQRERQELAYDEGLEAGLSKVEGIFEELGGNGITAALSEFFGALNDLANDPSSSTVRETVVQSASTLVTLIQDSDRRLAQAQTDANNQIKRDVVEISSIAADIADVNDRIFEQELNEKTTASSLRDRRSELLRDLGQKIDYTSSERADGTVQVFVAGGFLLVDGQTAASLQTTTDQSGGALSNASFVHVQQVLGGSVAGPITTRVTGGEIGAAIALRDDRILHYRQELDEFAYTLASRVNAVHLAGRGLDDASARNLFTDPSLGGGNVPGDVLASVAGSASAISVNPGIVANARHLAAGTPASGAASAGDNSNALLLAQIETASSAFYQTGDTPGSPSGSTSTVGDFFDAVSGELGSELQSARRAVAQEELIVAELETRRGAVSGVSIDEEVTNLVAFEKAYQASARVLSTVDRLLELLLNL